MSTGGACGIDGKRASLLPARFDAKRDQSRCASAPHKPIRGQRELGVITGGWMGGGGVGTILIEARPVGNRETTTLSPGRAVAHRHRCGWRSPHSQPKQTVEEMEEKEEM